jgi:D-alanyl-D-alanine carboxypeptidase
MTDAVSAQEPRPVAQPAQPMSRAEQRPPIIIRETRIHTSSQPIPRQEQAPIIARETPTRAPEAARSLSEPTATIPRAAIPAAENPPPLTAETSIIARETQGSPIVPASLPPTRGTTARGTWVIQLGAFPAEGQAKDRLSEAQSLGKALLANASSFTERVTKGRQELYRARFAGFDRNAAEAACSYFKRNDIDCMAVMGGR